MFPRIACASLWLALISTTLVSCRGGGIRWPFGKARHSGDLGSVSTGATQVLAGTIRLVRAPLGFVLIQSSGSPPPPGSELYVHRSGSDQPIATLQVSPETKTGFVVADILSGQPEEGDSVLWSLPSSVPGGEPEPQDVQPTLPGLPPVPMQIDPGPQKRIVPPDEPVLSPEAELEREIRRGGGVQPLG
jgi:hypothetical protein